MFNYFRKGSEFTFYTVLLYLLNEVGRRNQTKGI